MSLHEPIARAIEAGLTESIDRATPSIVDTVLAALWKHPAYAVVAGGQLRLMRTGILPGKAWEMSKSCLIEFLKDQGVKVGDPRFAWDDEAGRTLVEEYEIEHWDAKP